MRLQWTGFASAPALAAIGIIAAGAVLASALTRGGPEISANAGPVLDVSGDGNWNLAIIHPEETFNTTIAVGLSGSALANPGLKSVSYEFACNSPPNSAELNICGNITVIKHEPSGGNPQTLPYKGSLSPSDTTDGFTVDISVPDCIGAHDLEPSQPEINCDPDGDGILGVDVGAGISIRVVSIQSNPPVAAKNESYALAISAHIAPALDIDLQGTLDLGTVSPGQSYTSVLNVRLSDAFLQNPNVSGLLYRIVCRAPQSPSKLNVCKDFAYSVDGIPFPAVQGEIHRKSLDKGLDVNDAWTIEFVAPGCIGTQPQVPNMVDCDPDGDGILGIDLGAGISIEVLDVNRINAPVVVP